MIRLHAASRVFAHGCRTVVALLGLDGLRGLVARRRGLARGLVSAQLEGALAGPFLYVRARSRAREIEREFGPQARIGAP